MPIKYLCLLSCLLIVVFMAGAQTKPSRKQKKIVYQEVSFEDMIRRYFGKEKSTPFEGIYSVSCGITTRKKRFLSNRERIKVVERKDNYARVAIMKDWPESSRDYVEITLSYRDARRYPIVGEFSILSEGKGLIYKHIEPDGTPISFSMMRESDEMLEAEYSVIEGRKTITYRLSYLKVYPKTSALTVFKDQ